MSVANDGFATSRLGNPPVGSTVDSKSAHPHARVIAVTTAVVTTRISVCGGVVLRGSARIARLPVKVDTREHARREQTARRVEELAGEPRRSPRVHRTANEPIRPGRAQLED